MPQSMTREAALRIGLAAQALSAANVPGFVHALADKLGLPLTESRLSSITVTDLREILAGEHAEENCVVGVSPEDLKQAVRLLWGENVLGSELPQVAAYADGELPESIRVAFASNHGEELDGHFGSCERFLIYQVTSSESRLIEVRPTLEAEYDEDHNAARARMIADCQVVYVQSIGGPAAAKVVRANVHPVKIAKACPVSEVLERLQVTLHRPPPWLAKVMGVKAASLEKFAESMEE